MNFPVEMRTNCGTWLIKTKSPLKLQRTQFICKIEHSQHQKKSIQYIKSKVYVKNNENISDIKAAIISWGVQQWRTSVDDWKRSFGIRGEILKNK